VSSVNRIGGKCKGKGHPITYHYRHMFEVDIERSTFSISAMGRVCDQLHSLAALPPGKRLDSHCTGICFDPWVGLHRCGEEKNHATQRVQTPTLLLRFLCHTDTQIEEQHCRISFFFMVCVATISVVERVNVW
jgi:hypothetical protein